MRLTHSLLVCSLAALSWTACSDTAEEPGGDVVDSVTQTIGTAGGTIELAGAKLAFPAGALTGDTEITVAQLSGQPGTGYTAQSDLFEFSPSGLQFAQPVDLTLGFTGGTDDLNVFLTALSGTGFEQISGTVNGQQITAPITHFSQAFAGTSTGASSTITLDTLETEMLTIYCHVYATCGLMSSVESCKSFLGLLFSMNGEGFNLTEQRRAIAANRMTFDSAKAEACRAGVLAITTCSSTDIDSAFDSVPACDGVFKGQVAAGANCYFDDECVTGHFCSDTSQTCPGTCQPYVALNGTLDSDDECVSGLEKYNGTCLSPVALGSSCAAVAPSSFERTCVDGAYCDTATTTCVAYKTQGATCAGRGECAEGYNCVKAAEAETGTCEKGRVLDQACDYMTNLGCTMDLVCVPSAAATYTGTCELRGNAGATCYHHSMCNPDFRCSGTFQAPGTCVADLAAGAACTSNEECVTSAYCDTEGQTATKTCMTKKAAGGACTDDSECQPGLDCDPNNLCVAEQDCKMP